MIVRNAKRSFGEEMKAQQRLGVKKKVELVRAAPNIKHPGQMTVNTSVHPWIQASIYNWYRRLESAVNRPKI
jgi:hypothetical protein